MTVLILALLAATPATAAEFVTAAATAEEHRTIEDVTRTHQRLTAWSTRFAGRLQRSESILPSDPLRDGRARLEVRRLREVLATADIGNSVRRAIVSLAAAHERRLDALEAMYPGDFNGVHFSENCADVEHHFALLRPTGR